jgi:hypothetical protein
MSPFLIIANTISKRIRLPTIYSKILRQLRGLVISREFNQFDSHTIPYAIIRL